MIANAFNRDAYSDIRRMERPVPYRPRMPRQNRAKIFAPYDALKPFEATVHAKDVVYVPRIELSDYALEQLDRRLRKLKRGDTVTVTWFRPCGPDALTGQYAETSGTVAKIDEVHHLLYLGKQAIPFTDIVSIGGVKNGRDSEGRAAVPELT